MRRDTWFVVLLVTALCSASYAEVLQATRGPMPLSEARNPAFSELEVVCCPGQAWVAGQLIVGFRPGTSLASVQGWAARLGLIVIQPISSNPYSASFLIAVPVGQELAYIPRCISAGALYAEVNGIGCLYDYEADCCCCPGGLICPNLPACATLPPVQRGSGFWRHQCGDEGFQHVSEEDLDTAFQLARSSSAAYAFCGATSGCSALTEPAPSDLVNKVEKELQALWLNVGTCRLSTETDISLPEISAAPTVGAALWEIERTLCHPDSTVADLARVKDLAEAINTTGDDLDLVVPVDDIPVNAGRPITLTAGLVNLSDASLSVEVSASSEWPVALSPTQVRDLASGEAIPVTAEVNVPLGVSPGQAVLVHWTVTTMAPGFTMQRDAYVRLKVVQERIGGPSPRVQVSQ